jgi:hypothetical protein
VPTAFSGFNSGFPEKKVPQAAAILHSDLRQHRVVALSVLLHVTPSSLSRFLGANGRFTPEDKSLLRIAAD